MKTRTKEQKAAGVDGADKPLKTEEELRGGGWAPHFPAGFESDIWDVPDKAVVGCSESEHRRVMNKRLAAKPFEKLRPRTQAEILEANRESVLIMHECGERPYIIAGRFGVTKRTVDNFFEAEDKKETA